MSTLTIETVRQHIAWSYANLARAHAALDVGATKYTRTHHMVRARLFKGLSTSAMQMRTLYDDERVKLNYPQACCYCGATNSLSIDHLIAKIRGGEDHSDNLVWACKSCNSSKRDRDLLEWCQFKNTFPSVLLLRRYMKLVARYCETHGLLDTLLADDNCRRLPFVLELLPYTFPDLNSLVLWVPVRQPESSNSTGDT